MSHLSKIQIPIFLHHFHKTSKCFILMQTPLQLDIWLQRYEGFDNAKNNMKQRNFNTVFANISKTTSPTSDSFLLIMSHILNPQIKPMSQTYWHCDSIFSLFVGSSPVDISPTFPKIRSEEVSGTVSSAS